MAAGLLTGSTPVAKSKGKAADQPPADPPFGRIELQAPPEWIDELDEVARRMGMSRSAYIRQACNVKMAADKTMLGMK